MTTATVFFTELSGNTKLAARGLTDQQAKKLAENLKRRNILGIKTIYSNGVSHIWEHDKNIAKVQALLALY